MWEKFSSTRYNPFLHTTITTRHPPATTHPPTSHWDRLRWNRHILVIWGTLDQAPLVQLSKVQAQKSTLEQAHLILVQPGVCLIQRIFVCLIQRVQCVDDPE